MNPLRLDLWFMHAVGICLAIASLLLRHSRILLHPFVVCFGSKSTPKVLSLGNHGHYSYFHVTVNGKIGEKTNLRKHNLGSISWLSIACDSHEAAVRKVLKIC